MKRTRLNENASFKLFLRIVKKHRVNETFRHYIKESQVKVDKLWIIQTSGLVGRHSKPSVLTDYTILMRGPAAMQANRSEAFSE